MRLTNPFRTTPSVILLSAAAAGVAPAAAEPVVFARHLTLAPDGQTLAFSWAGDIWSVPTAGGTARRLTVNPAHDTSPVWSRDGRRLAFSSDREGSTHVYTMTPDGMDVQRLTFADVSETPTDFSPDGSAVYFHARREGHVFWEPMVYRVASAGGQAVPALPCFAADARISPDGESIAFVRGGSNWWRRRYRGSANYDVWTYRSATGAFRQVTNFDGTDRAPQWTADGAGLLMLSDRDGGSVNIWHQPLAGGDPRQVTRMSGDDVRDFALSADGRTLAFTHWDRVYVMNYPDGQPREISVEAGGDSPRRPVEQRTFSGSADEAEASPDGKEVALVVRGEIYVIKTADNKPTRRVTQSPARDRHVTWSPDGAALYFISDPHGQEDIFRATSADREDGKPKALSDSLRFTIERVTDHPGMEFGPSVSPDGEKLAFIRGRGELVVRTLKSGVEQTLLTGWDAPNFRWSPDSQWLAYQREDHEFNPDVWIVPADGSAAPVNISQHPDMDSNPQWSADGQVLTFASNRSGFDTDLYLVFLSPALDEKSSVDLAEYFEGRAEAVKKRKPPKATDASGRIVLAGEPPATQPATSPTTTAKRAASRPKGDKKDAGLRGRVRSWVKELLDEPTEGDRKDEAREDEKKPKKDEQYAYDLATAWKRIRRVTSLEGNQVSYALAPDGATLVFASSHAGEAGLYSIRWNGEDAKRIIAGAAARLHWTLDGSRLFFLKAGVPNSCKDGGSDAKAHAFSAKLAIDIAAESAQKWDDAARTLGAGFYHPTLKGLDWPALSRKHRSLALQTRTITEFNEIFNMFQGELNASHLGIGGPGGGVAAERVGYLGCDFDPAFAGPGLKVAYVLPESPAARTESRLYVGDVLLRVNGVPVGPDAPLEAALVSTVGDPVIVEYLPSAERTKPAASQPASGPASQPAGGPTTQPGTAPAATTAPASAPAAAEVVIRPISFGELSGRRYDAWVADNARYVAEKSGGRIGYCHIRGMSEPSFHTFERDLYAVAHGKDGLIIDVRNNGGGWTADWVLAVLTVRRHAFTIPRGGERGYPQDRLIFYSWTKPTSMMCNQYSYSNAEIISHAFKNLQRGPLVGMTTFGAVISTGSYGLIDGATIRMPFRGWYTVPGGVDMENNGAVPDVLVVEGPEAEAAGRRPQLDAAIRATLDEIAKAPRE